MTNTDTMTNYANIDVPVKRARVTAVVEFDAWVIDYDAWTGDDAPAPDDAYRLDEDQLRDRIGGEIGDAVQYRAVHLTDTDPGDGLVAMVRGGDTGVVEVRDVEVVDLTEGEPEQGAHDAIEHTKAWI